MPAVYMAKAPAAASESPGGPVARIGQGSWEKTLGRAPGSRAEATEERASLVLAPRTVSMGRRRIRAPAACMARTRPPASESLAGLTREQASSLTAVVGRRYRSTARLASVGAVWSASLLARRQRPWLA